MGAPNCMLPLSEQQEIDRGLDADFQKVNLYEQNDALNEV